MAEYEPLEHQPLEHQPPHSADGPRWTSTLLLGLGFVLVVGAAAAYLLFGREPTAGAPIAADPPATSSRAATTTRERPTVPPVAPPVAPPATAPPASAAPGERIDITGISEQRTVDCAGKPVEISGISHTVILTGHCGRIAVSGIQNVVTVDSADAIEVSGIRNRVTFHTGTPEIETSGDNTVERG